MSDIEIRQATTADLDALMARSDTAQERRAEAARFEAQEGGEGLLLIAWEDETVRGRVRLRWWSKYIEVIDEFGEFPEINALDAWPQGTGVGTRIIAKCEQISVDRGEKQMGIGVVKTNVDARRLYERLGYEYWGDVIDRSEYFDDAGNVVHVQEDPCVYLIKNIT